MIMAYITELNAKNYQQFIKNNNLAMVDIWANWCSPCKLLSPIVDEVSVDLSGVLSVGKLDADSNSEILKETNIRNIPAILIYRNGELVDKSIGLVSKQKLIDLVNKYV